MSIHVPIPANPVIYEINTWTWLHALAERLGRPVTLADVPGQIWDTLAPGPVDAVWLMGVWQRSPAGIAIALAHPGLVATFAETLPDYTAADVVGSPYCVGDYVVDAHLGGPAGLAAARAALAERGIALILDYVPNHVAVDHRWATAHPDRFVTGSDSEIASRPAEFVQIGEVVYAHGRDPHFAPWTDVLQLDAFAGGTRAAARETLCDIATQCDGVRCDMAMLVTNDIFADTWSGRVGPPPAVDYWDDLIPAVREHHPEFLFVAECYWGTQDLLRSQGFDLCYDKAFTDTLIAHPHAIAGRIGEAAGAAGRVRFIENHDEPRAQAVFGTRHLTAAITALTQPGARLVHDGQCAGRSVRVPVQLRRGPAEATLPDLLAGYRRVLALLADPAMHVGTCAALEIGGWSDASPGAGLVAWSWTLDTTRLLFVVNLDDHHGAGRIHTPWPELAGRAATLVDVVTGEEFARPADPDPTVFVMLAGWGAHVVRVEVTAPRTGPAPRTGTADTAPTRVR
ncbi:MAG: alpha-amylase family glycosyl hydrolase [Gordonia sp. (in: high G+C Gram-positive bacteria)]